jgi:hypothetical protein
MCCMLFSRYLESIFTYSAILMSVAPEALLRLDQGRHSR